MLNVKHSKSFEEQIYVRDEYLLNMILNTTYLEGLTLKEARKLIETSKDKLDLTIQKPAQQQPNMTNSCSCLQNNCSNFLLLAILIYSP